MNRNKPPLMIAPPPAVVYAHIGLLGNPNVGKSISAMAIMSRLCGNQRFAVLNTEFGAAHKYAKEFEFDVFEIGEDCNPLTITEYVDELIERGYPGIILDSGSDEWEGKEGVLPTVRKYEEKKSEREFGRAWGHEDTGGGHLKWITAFNSVPAHTIVTIKTKDKLEKTTNNDGSETYTMVTGRPIQRRGTIFNLDMAVMITSAGAQVIKARIPLNEKSKANFPVTGTGWKPDYQSTFAWTDKLIAWLKDQEYHAEETPA